MKTYCWLLLFAGLWLTALQTPCLAEPLPPTSAVTDDPVPEPSKPMDSHGPSGVSSNDRVATMIAQPDESAQEKQPSAPSISENSKESPDTISDPLEPVNRAFFHVNDKLYFWIFKPVASGYKMVFPEDIRLGVQNFFSNVATPIRLVNCLLQANLKGAGNEAIRFLVNTTFGWAGFLDPAQKELGIEKRDEDFGQTLGVWGLGSAFYLEWPIIGASSLRDSLGYPVDLSLDPTSYIPSAAVRLGVKTYDKVNEYSLRIGEYEDLKKFAIDPYIAKRDAYYQNRKYKIKERK